MNSLFKRILLAVLALPALFAVVWFLPQYNHLLLNSIVLVFTILGVREMLIIFKAKSQPVSAFMAYTPAVLLLFLTYCNVRGWVPSQSFILAFLFFTVIPMIRSTFIKNLDGAEAAMEKVKTSYLVLLYPTVFISYILRIGSLSTPKIAYLAFFVIIFSNDTMAYIVGMLFGRRSWKPFPVSPKKSLVGFIGGISGSLIAAMTFWFLTPELFNNKLIFAILTGFVLSVTTIFGDLFESVFKRAAHVKDSGHLMLGRGGVLDSTDSLIFSAPFFYYILHFAAQG